MQATVKTKCSAFNLVFPHDDGKRSVYYDSETVVEDTDGVVIAKADATALAVIPSYNAWKTTPRTITSDVTGQPISLTGKDIAAWILADYAARKV